MKNIREAASQVASAARAALPETLLRKSGRALYSPASTLVSDSPVYFLGINPGETPGGTEAHDLLTIESDLRRLERDEIAEHGYLDETWKGHHTGGAPMQVRAQFAFSILAGGASQKGVDLLRRTPTSNMVLVRSSAEAELKHEAGASPPTIASWCWPFHQAVIEIKQPRIVLTHAVGIARSLTKSWGLGPGEQRPSGWGGTLSTLYAWKLPEGPMMLALPNLGRYQPDGPREQPLREFFREFAPSVS